MKNRSAEMPERLKLPFVWIELIYEDGPYAQVSSEDGQHLVLLPEEGNLTPKRARRIAQWFNSVADFLEKR